MSLRACVANVKGRQYDTKGIVKGMTSGGVYSFARRRYIIVTGEQTGPASRIVTASALKWGITVSHSSPRRVYEDCQKGTHGKEVIVPFASFSLTTSNIVGPCRIQMRIYRKRWSVEYRWPEGRWYRPRAHTLKGEQSKIARSRTSSRPLLSNR